MKIVSYNISNCQQWKVDRLLEMDADVYVVPELSCPEEIKLPEGYGILWQGIKWEANGKPCSKGLGIIYKKYHAKVSGWYKSSLFYAIPLYIKGYEIIAFWPTKNKNEEKSYPQIAQEIINHYIYDKSHDYSSAILIGDFNCFCGQKEGGRKFGDMKRVNKILNKQRFKSIYHHVTKEKLGEETKATYFHNFKEDKPFFLDYAYTNSIESVEHYELLPWDAEMSDHVGQVLQMFEPEVDTSLPEPCRYCVNEYICELPCDDERKWEEGKRASLPRLDRWQEYLRGLDRAASNLDYYLRCIKREKDQLTPSEWEQAKHYFEYAKRAINSFEE